MGEDLLIVTTRHVSIEVSVLTIKPSISRLIIKLVFK